MSITKRMVFLPYDFDTALGINNEGTLTFSYNLEDIDTVAGGADVYNGQQSVLWKNMRAAFFEEIKAMYQELRSSGKLSYEVVEQMFENHQDKWPEAIFNEDAYFKYIAPLVAPDAGEQPTAVYLPMLQGSKEEQRKWWLYNRFRYIDSKYNAGDALTDVIQLRGYAKANITVTPYADIYPSIKYGSYLVTQRGQRLVPTTLVNPLDNVNDTEIYIYSASQLMSVGDISGLKVGFADFSMATRLVNLKIGDSSGSYSNGNLTELTLGNNTLLKTLDVRNCPNLTRPVDVSGCSNIEEVYFDGTAITSCSLPNGGVLKILRLPSTITNLTIRNQPSITTFYMPSYSNITTLRLENVGSGVNPLAILSDLAPLSRVRLLGWTLTVSSTDDVEDFYDLLDTMRGLDEQGGNLDKAVVQGVITGLGTITGDWLAEMEERYPQIEIRYEHITGTLRYYNYNGTTLLYSETFTDGGDGTYTGAPTRPSTVYNTYTFIGWSRYMNQFEADPDATKNVLADRNVYAAYEATGTLFTVKFYNGDTLLQQQSVPYGEEVIYAGEEPTYTGDLPELQNFLGWSQDTSFIDSNIDTYAVYEYQGTDKTRQYLMGKLGGSYTNDRIIAVRCGAFENNTKLLWFSGANVVEADQSSFFGCTKLSKINLPKATNISNNAFKQCTSLRSVDLPAATLIAPEAFNSCSSLRSINLPEATEIRGQAFRGTRLTSFSGPKVTRIHDNAFSEISTLTTVDLPEVTRIDHRGLYKTSITNINIPKVQYLDSYCLSNITTLTTITLPETITGITTTAFSGCTNLLDIYVSWPEGTIADAPWGAINATIHYPSA